MMQDVEVVGTVMQDVEVVGAVLSDEDCRPVELLVWRQTLQPRGERVLYFQASESGRDPALQMGLSCERPNLDREEILHIAGSVVDDYGEPLGIGVLPLAVALVAEDGEEVVDTRFLFEIPGTGLRGQEALHSKARHIDLDENLFIFAYSTGVVLGGSTTVDENDRLNLAAEAAVYFIPRPSTRTEFIQLVQRYLTYGSWDEAVIATWPDAREGEPFPGHWKSVSPQDARDDT